MWGNFDDHALPRRPFDRSLIPAHVEPTLAAAAPVEGRLVQCVGGASGKKGKERTAQEWTIAGPPALLQQRLTPEKRQSTGAVRDLAFAGHAQRLLDGNQPDLHQFRRFGLSLS